jgi:hypothetical protein
VVIARSSVAALAPWIEIIGQNVIVSIPWHRFRIVVDARKKYEGGGSPRR